MNTSTTELNELTDDELNELVNFKPVISDEEMMQLEEAANDEARGLQRRLCLVACARSMEEISKLSIEKPDAFTEMMEAIEAFKAHVEGLAEVVKTAYIRMKIADLRNNQQA